MKQCKLHILAAFSVAIAMICSSCDKFFDVNTDEIMLDEHNYEKIGEVYSGFLGIASAFQTAADDYIVLSELRGDYVTPTSYAPMDFWEVYRYRTTEDNDLYNPSRYYRIIMNSNDFLRNVVDFNLRNPNAIPEKIYKGLIASAITYRTWAYLTIGKIYGEAVYYDYALADKTDLTAEYLMPLDALVNELIYFMKNGVDGVDAWNELPWSEVIGESADDWNYMTVNPNVLMAELHLWNNSPWDAATSALQAISSGLGSDGKVSTDKYKLSSSYQGSGWKNIFSGAYSTIANEAFTAIPFDYSKGQTNKLQYYFSNLDPNVYYLTVNTRQYVSIINNERHRSAVLTVENGSAVVAKYHLDKKPYEWDNHIYIYRAADAWLMLAEALTSAGDFAQADTILNNGMKQCWDGKKFSAPFDSPIYTSDLQKNIGIRGRVGADPNRLSDYVVDSLFVDETLLNERKTFVLDSLIAAETGVEACFEGKRWYTLLRMARNLNKPEFLADPISGKFNSAEGNMYKMWLLEPKNWFVKYDQLGVVNGK